MKPNVFLLTAFAITLLFTTTGCKNPNEPGVNNGTVTFKAYYEPGSQFIGNTAAQEGIEAVLDQFEATLRTSGTWDTTIDIFFTDNETSAYASCGTGSAVEITNEGKVYYSQNPWIKIVTGDADPNGAIDPTTGTGADIRMNWNFALSQPEDNLGLTRHELMHGLGMVSGISGPTWASGGSIEKPYTGTSGIPTICDRQIRDANDDPVFGDYNEETRTFILNDYAVDNDWDDDNGSGLVFRGIDDSGKTMDMPYFSMNPTNGYPGKVDFSHVYVVMYANKHPDWNNISEVDRAFLRGMGYAVVTPKSE